jgi:hypothetical protein
MPNVLSISSLTVLLIAIDLPAQREFMPDQFALQRFRRGRPQASIVGASMATTTIRAVSLPRSPLRRTATSIKEISP